MISTTTTPLERDVRLFLCDQGGAVTLADDDVAALLGFVRDMSIRLTADVVRDLEDGELPPMPTPSDDEARQALARCDRAQAIDAATRGTSCDPDGAYLQDLCDQCRTPRDVIETSVEEDPRDGALFKVVHLSCGHTAQQRLFRYEPPQVRRD